MPKIIITLLLPMLLLGAGCGAATSGGGEIKITNTAEKPAPAQNLYNLDTADSENVDDCVIKGNISSSGEKIYHLPGCGSYSRTVIDESAGEEWFCSEDDAEAAGWRKAKNCP